MIHSQSEDLTRIARLFKTRFKIETRMYFHEKYQGGYSGLYLQYSWDEKSQTSGANRSLFEDLAKFDLQRSNADPSRLLRQVCKYGGFEQTKVKT